MVWARMLAYITGTVDQKLLLRNEYLAAENPEFNAAKWIVAEVLDDGAAVSVGMRLSDLIFRQPWIAL